jgi:hypothetical protein
MSISRRGFFRGLTGKSEDRERDLQRRRVQSVDSYVRTNLFPYDFAITEEQAADALAAAVAAIEVDLDGDRLTEEHRTRIREIVEARIERWREEYLKAEEVRREAVLCVGEFLSVEATSEELQTLQQRFHTSDPAALEEEAKLQIRIWLGSLPNARLAVLDRAEARGLVFSELRSWC